MKRDKPDKPGPSFAFILENISQDTGGYDHMMRSNGGNDFGMAGPMAAIVW